MQLKNQLRSLLIAGLSLVTASASVAQEADFNVIVNSGLSVSALSSKEVANIFMKKKTTWPSGLRITPVNLVVGEPTRETFSREIHGKSAQAIQRRWETLIFSGMGVPPVEVASQALVVEFVKNNADAIGYVSAATPLPAEVKVLEIEK